MKKLLSVYSLILLCICFSTMIKAQIVELKPHSKFINIGLYSAGSGANFIDTLTGDKHNMRVLKFEPTISLYYKGQLGIGIIGSYTQYRGNLVKNDDLFELGSFVRYYNPLQLNIKVLDKLSFIHEISYRYSNFVFDSKSSYVKSKGLINSMFKITPIGFQYRVFKKLNVEISPEWVYYSRSINYLTGRLGIEYSFTNNKSESLN